MAKKTQIDPLEIFIKTDWHEYDELEFKSAKGGFPASLWQTYSAFANSNGGIILLGVEDDGTVSGLNKSSLPNLKKTFWDTINNRGKVSFNLMTQDGVKEVSYGSDIILAISVPRAKRTERPVYTGQNPLAGTYRRNHEGDYHCSQQEVKRMLSDQSEETSADRKILENFTFDDLDHRSFKEYRNRFASHKPDHSWLLEDDLSLLKNLGGFRKERKSDLEGVTVAGILMFGKDETIREALPQYQVDYREKFSSDPQVRWTDRVTIDGTWNANLFQFYLKMMPRLTQDLKLHFELDENLSRKGETPVHKAIREALVNSLIHADYCGQGGIVIEKTRDRFEFSNPGSSLIPIKQLLDQKSHGGISECRNKTLQKMFMMIGAAEQAGSGINKIYRGWESENWQKPTALEIFQPDRVHWILPMTSLIAEKSLSHLKKIFGPKFKNLSPLEVQILAKAAAEGFVNNNSVQQITHTHPADITKTLQSLVLRKMLLKENERRWALYRLNIQNEVGSSLGNDLNSLGNEGNSLGNEGNSLGNEGNSLGNDPELKLILTQMKGRNKPQEMEEIIKKLCSDRWLTRREIAVILKRNPEDLRNRILNPMAARGILELRYPDIPKSPDQSYRTSANTKSTLIST